MSGNEFLQRMVARECFNCVWTMCTQSHSCFSTQTDKRLMGPHRVRPCVQTLWNFILSAALGVQKLIVDFCLDGLLPGAPAASLIYR